MPTYAAGNPPFALGTTYRGLDDDSNEINDDFMGMIYQHQSPVLSSVSGVRDRNAERFISAVCLRNDSGVVLFGKRLAQFELTAGLSVVERADGYPIVQAQKGLILIDPFGTIPTDGVPIDDLFWGLFEGVCIARTPFTGAAFALDIAVGAQLVSSTINSTSQNSNAGGLGNFTVQDTLNNTEVYAMVNNHIAVAMSARTTGETNADLLVNLQIRI
jgi:hypothetical protein